MIWSCAKQKRRIVNADEICLVLVQALSKLNTVLSIWEDEIVNFEFEYKLFIVYRQ